MTKYDVVVLGLGGMGSAAAAHLAKRRKRVLGLEQFALGHELGASAGQTRIIRKAYFEGLSYVPLLLRAYELWRELELDTQTTLLDLVGSLMVGVPDGAMLEGVRLCSVHHAIEIEELSAAEIVRRFPRVRVEAGEIGLREPDAGIVFPERAIAAHQQVARANGAELRGNVRVRSWQRSTAGTIHIDLAGGERIETEQLVVCAGPWLRETAQDLELPLRVQRNVQIWFSPANAGFARGDLPVFFLSRSAFPKPLYGFPDLGNGLKAALHGFGETTTPQLLDRDIHPADIAVVKLALDALLPGAANEFRFGKACMYSLTPDEHFIIDRHPNDDGVIIAGGFSGHGYKFCPVVGEIIADLIFGNARHDIDFLSLRRFTSSAYVA